jgi:hypothetical protein
MPDLSEFRMKANKPCKVAMFVVSLPQEDREKIEAAFIAPDIRTTDIRRWVAKRGEIVSLSTVQRHRLGECSCG